MAIIAILKKAPGKSKKVVDAELEVVGADFYFSYGEYTNLRESRG